MKRCEVDRSKLAPMMAKYMEIKDNYEDTIIFFRLGDFYELFYETDVDWLLNTTHRPSLRPPSRLIMS